MPGPLPFLLFPMDGDTMPEQYRYSSSVGLDYVLRRIGRRAWEVHQEREDEHGVFDLWGVLRARHRVQLQRMVELKVNGLDWGKPRLPQVLIPRAPRTANPIRLSPEAASPLP